MNLANAYADQGDLASALRVVRGALRRTRDVGVRHNLSTLYANIGLLSALDGNLAACREGLRKAVEEARAQGQPQQALAFEMYLGSVLIECGVWAEGEAVLRRVLAGLSEVDRWELEVGTRAQLSLLWSLTAHAEKAASVLAPLPEEHPVAAAARARLERVGGRPDRALSLLAVLVPGGPDACSTPELLLEQGWSLLDTGRVAEAMPWLDQAVRVGMIGDWTTVARALRGAARLATGDDEGGRTDAEAVLRVEAALPLERYLAARVVADATGWAHAAETAERLEAHLNLPPETPWIAPRRER